MQTAKNLADVKTPVEHTFLYLNGVKLHIVMAGPLNGRPILLLHGFPEFWHGWHHAIEALVAAGRRVIIPDQRGYNLSDKPTRIQDYCIDVLAKDIADLIEALGGGPMDVAGHDWGAMVAWFLAMKHQSLVRRLIIANVPHPVIIKEHLRTNWRQKKRSWYMQFFNLPWLPEWALSRRGFAALSESLQKTSRPGTFTDSDLQEYVRAWSQPGAIRAMLSWYRAFLRKWPALPKNIRVHVPTLILWGRKDQALGEEMVQPSVDLCDNAQLILFENTTHWILHEEPQRVVEEILRFTA